MLLGAVAASHLLADLITSRMVLWPGGSALGLHLYVHRWADLLLESATVLAGWRWYLRTLPEKRRLSVPSIAISLLLLTMQGVMATMDVS